MLFPAPHAAQKFFAPDVVSRHAFGIELALDDHLGRDAGVIGARLPEGVVALHAVITHQGIHDGVLEGVTHVQAARDIGRRNHDAVGLTLATRLEVAIFFPYPVPGLLYFPGVVGLIHSLLE